jgi:hypothetical protein
MTTRRTLRTRPYDSEEEVRKYFHSIYRTNEDDPYASPEMIYPTYTENEDEKN